MVLSSYAPITLPTSRTKRVAAKSIAAIPAESIPFIGVAVLVADTGYELYVACETVRDLDQLYGELGMEEEATDDAMHSVCDPELPKPGHIRDWVIEKRGRRVWCGLCRNTTEVGRPDWCPTLCRSTVRTLTYYTVPSARAPLKYRLHGYLRVPFRDRAN